MKTNEDRAKLIKHRARELRRRHRKYQTRIVSLSCIAVCLAFVIILSASLPGIIHEFSDIPVVYSSGTASLISNCTMLGYILIGIISFALGICVTLFLTHLRQRMRENENDKL